MEPGRRKYLRLLHHDAGRGISFVREPRTGLLHARPPFDGLVAGGDLLHGPTVAVRVGEEDETDVV